MQRYSRTRTTDRRKLTATQTGRQKQICALYRSENARGALHNFKARKQAHGKARKDSRLKRQSQLRALHNLTRLLDYRQISQSIQMVELRLKVEI